MNLNDRTLLAKIQALPPTLQEEVINFVNFLSQRSANDSGSHQSSESIFEVCFEDEHSLSLQLSESSVRIAG